MNKTILLVLIPLIFLAVFGAVILSPDKNTSADKKVAATIFPLCDIVKNIAGPKVEVACILPPGVSPHTFDPSPQEVKKITGSLALFSIGNGLDDWSQVFAQSADIKKLVVVDKNITLLEGGLDPHYWLSVPNAVLISSQVKDELAMLFPDSAPEFEKNLAEYTRVLTQLQNEIDSGFNKLSNREISTFHGAWSYFGRDHQIDIVTTFEEYPGEEPTVQYLKAFQNDIRSHGIKVIFSEPHFSTQPLEPIAKDLGVTISVLDPIGGVPGRDSYVALMRFNADNIITALK